MNGSDVHSSVALAVTLATIQRPPALCCSVLQCVAVCCSALQCVALCCSALQSVLVCCSVTKKTVPPSKGRCGVLQCVAVSALCCSVTNFFLLPFNIHLHCVAVCCSVLQCVVVWCNVLQCVSACCSVTKKTLLPSKDYLFSCVWHTSDALKTNLYHTYHI